MQKKDYSNFTISGESSDTRSSHFESIKKRLARIACKITMVKFGESHISDSKLEPIKF